MQRCTRQPAPAEQQVRVARRALADHGLATILKKHTCAHRVRQLLAIYQEVRAEVFLDEPILILTEP